MGYMRHHAIVVTSWKKELIQEAHDKAKEIFNGTATEILQSTMNGYLSFFIATDGSKEGWNDSNLGDLRRKRFINWCKKQVHEDGSSSLNWAELFYGDDEDKARIVNHN